MSSHGLELIPARAHVDNEFYGSPMDRWLGFQLAAASILLAGGLLVAGTAYSATSTRASDPAPEFGEVGDPPGRLVPIFVPIWERSHFDPLTGEPKGWTYTANKKTGGTYTVVGPVPADMVGRRAIPVPVGFALGAVPGLLLLLLARKRRKRNDTSGTKFAQS